MGGGTRAEDGATVATTARMVLRRFTPADLPDLVALDDDPEVMRYINDSAPVDDDEVRAILGHWLAEHEAGDDFGCWAAVDRADGAFLGWFHLRPDAERPDVPELGYRLRREVWGRGLATEGSLALIDRCFATTRASAVRAETLAVHTASRRVMERCGMVLARTFVADWPVVLPGSEHGDVEYVITREAWAARQPRS